jgi:hypothetical protein
MSESSVSSLAIYQLRVVRCGVSPLVWRRLLMVNETSLANSMKSFRMSLVRAANICTAFLLLLFYLFTFWNSSEATEILLMRLCFHWFPLRPERSASAGKRGEHNFANLVQRWVKSFRDLGFKNGV